MPTHPLALSVLLLAGMTAAQAQGVPAQAPVSIPVLVPVTGFLASEGRSQRNGALLALRHAPENLAVRHEVLDTATAPETAVNALERAGPGALAVIAPMLGTQMLALLPLATEMRLPLLTISGTAAITRQGSPWVFRFFPDDAVTKEAQVRFAVQERGMRHPAVITQTTAYGQSGRLEILAALKRQGVTPAFEDALDVGVRDMTPSLATARAAGADGLLIHLHAAPTALLVKAAAAMQLALPIVAGSGLAQPATTALLEPSELRGACAETGSSPLSAETPPMRAFLAEYRHAFDSDPDAFAVAQYDATMMLLGLAASGARTPEAVAQALAANTYRGLAMTYRSDGRGDMAHGAVIVCYPTEDRVPVVAWHYDAPLP